MKARLLDDLAEILVVLAVAEHRARAAQASALDADLDHAREHLFMAARLASGHRRRSDGMLRSPWVVTELVVMGVLAFFCGYAVAVWLELPGWLVAAVVVIIGQFALSLVSVPVTGRLDAWTLSAALPAGWPGKQPAPDAVVNEDVVALLTRARGLVGKLAVARLGRVRGLIRSGRAAQWAGLHDAFLLHLHHADAHLCGARLAWTRFGQGVPG